MGLLDDLRKQSEEIKDKEAQEEARRELAERVYREQIMPKMLDLYRHLNELTQHLNIVKLDVTAPYTFGGDGQSIELKQHDYITHIDSTTETKLVTCAFRCTSPRDFECTAVGKQAIDKYIDYLKKYNLQYQLQESRNPDGQINGARFTVKASIPVRFAFKADVENGGVALTYNNFDGLGLRHYNFKADIINEDFLDRMGRLIIREIDNFLTATMTDEARDQLRAQIIEEQRQRQRELEEAERFLAEEELKRKAEQANNRFGLLKKFTSSLKTGSD